MSGPLGRSEVPGHRGTRIESGSSSPGSANKHCQPGEGLATHQPGRCVERRPVIRHSRSRHRPQRNGRRKKPSSRSLAKPYTHGPPSVQAPRCGIPKPFCWPLLFGGCPGC